MRVVAALAVSDSNVHVRHVGKGRGTRPSPFDAIRDETSDDVRGDGGEDLLKRRGPFEEPWGAGVGWQPRRGHIRDPLGALSLAPRSVGGARPGRRLRSPSIDATRRRGSSRRRPPTRPVEIRARLAHSTPAPPARALLLVWSVQAARAKVPSGCASFGLNELNGGAALGRSGGTHRARRR